VHTTKFRKTARECPHGCGLA